MKKKLWYIASGDLGKAYFAATIHCREDVRGLGKCGWDATLFSQANPSEYIPDAEINEIVVPRGNPLICRLVFEAKVIIKLLFSNPKPDFVFFRGAGLLIPVLFIRLLRIPFGLELCGPPSCFLKSGKRKFWSRLSNIYILRHTSVIIALTRELAELASTLKKNDAVTAITGVGVNSDEFQVAPKGDAENSSELVLGFLGTVYANRGLGTTLKALCLLIESGLNAKLVVVGDGPYRQEAEKFVEDMRISDRVDFKGYILPQQLSEYMKDIDLTIALYQREEALTVGGINPMKVWTSLAIGKPILLFNPGKYNSYSGIPGIFSIRDNSPKVMSDEIRSIWLKHGQQGLMQAGLSGREYVNNNVTWLGHAEVIDKTIKQYLGQ